MATAPKVSKIPMGFKYARACNLAKDVKYYDYMEKGEQIVYKAFVTFETTSQEELNRFIQNAVELGGIALNPTAVVEEIQLPSDYAINREQFDVIAERFRISDAWKTRYWSALTNIQSDSLHPELFKKHRPLVNFVDLRDVRARLSLAEQGGQMPHGIGEKIWNILAELIDGEYPNDPDLPRLIPWDRNIHPRLVNLSLGRELVVTLMDKYDV